MLSSETVSRMESWLLGLWSSIKAELANLASAWTLLQLLVIIVTFLLSVLVARLITPPLEARLRRIENQPRLLRVLVIPLRQLRWILFALLLWAAALALSEMPPPSQTYLVWVAVSLAAAWAIISLASRFIRNRSLSRLVAIVTGMLAALSILGLLDQVLMGLDQTAITIGVTRISLLAVIEGLLLLGLFLWVARIVSDFVERRMRSNLDISATYQVLLSKLVKALLITLAILAALATVGLDLTTLAVFSGALGLGIGFGLQKLASNLLSGVIILMDRSIKPEDVISVGDTVGWVSALKARYVSVITRDGVEYLIPNETFVTEQVVNWSFSDRAVRLEIKFGVDYGSDPHAVRRLAIDAVSKLERVLTQRAVVCHLTAFGDSALEFVLRFWIADPENGITNVRGQALLVLWDVLKAEGIKIPYPHREIIVQRNVTDQTGGSVNLG
jgi:small-conductance mechanosensitive channel